MAAKGGGRRGRGRAERQGSGETLAGEVWPHTLLCGRRRRLRQLESWNNRTREREDEADERGSGKRAGEYSRELQPSRGSPSNEKRRRPERDPKLKPTRFRSVEFISPPPASREAMEKSELDVLPLGRKFRFAKVFPTGRGRGCVLPSKFNVVPRVCFIIQEAATQFEQPRGSKFVGQLSSTSRGMWKREFPLTPLLPVRRPRGAICSARRILHRART